MLYDFTPKTGGWKIRYSTAASSANSDGWNIYETYFNNTCPTIPRIRAQELQVDNGTGFKYVTPGNSNGYTSNALNCGNSWFFPGYYEDWYVN
jgi:hypothetical protein